MTSTWWAVALSEDIDATAREIDFGDCKLVLWRGPRGALHALEDRCPHRGVPLSQGSVQADGLACRDHGWVFDGTTGRLTSVPGMRPEQCLPEHLNVRAFDAAETAGFVFVATGPTSPPPAPSDRLPLRGVTHVTLGHSHYVAALLDDPAFLVSFRHVELATAPVAESAIEQGVVCLRRQAVWRGWRAYRRAAALPLSLVSHTQTTTGETTFRLCDNRRVLLSARLAPTPVARGVTAIFWRATSRDFIVRTVIDAARLRQLEPTTSRDVELSLLGRSSP